VFTYFVMLAHIPEARLDWIDGLKQSPLGVIVVLLAAIVSWMRSIGVRFPQCMGDIVLAKLAIVKRQAESGDVAAGRLELRMNVARGDRAAVGSTVAGLRVDLSPGTGRNEYSP
jgi:hypothetical protein